VFRFVDATIDLPTIVGAAAGGQPHQRGRVRHLPVERDPTEPPPGDRVGDLAAQRLVSAEIIPAV
jgi:hypothetical protein